MSWLKNRLEEAQANLNPFDGGKSMATVRRARNPAQPAQTMRKPSFIDKARAQVNVRDNGASWSNPNPAQRRIDQNNTVDTRGKQLRQQLQAGQITKEDFSREFGNSILQNTDQPSQFDKRNLALANAVERNRVLNPVLGSLAQWNPSNKVGDVGFAVGTTLRDRFGVKNGFNDALIASSADLTDQTDRLLTNGWSPKDNLADQFIRGGVGMVDQIATAAVNPIASAGLMGAQSYGNQYRNTVNGGGTFDAANKSGLVLGAGEAALEKIGLGKIMKGGGKLTTRLVTSALTEGVTEGSQTALENKVAQKTYDPNRSLAQGVVTSALVGGALGGVASGGMSAVNRYSGTDGKQKLTQDTEKTKKVVEVATDKKKLAQNAISNRQTAEARQSASWQKLQMAKDAGRPTATLQRQFERDSRAVVRAKALEKVALFNRDYQIGNSIIGVKGTGFEDAKKAGRVFEGVDGKPRFEVDDSGAKLLDKPAKQEAVSIPQEITAQKQALRNEMIDVAGTGDITKVQAINAKLKELDTKYPEGSKTTKTYAKDILDHQELYKQYPELRTVEIIKKKLNGKNGYATQNTAGQPVIVLDTVTLKNDPEYAKGTLLHELQHVIQNKERFAGGSSDPNYENYFKSAGEAEARAVANRMNMSDGERQSKGFYDSLDVPKKDLIIRDGSGKAMSMDTPQGKTDTQVEIDRLQKIVDNPSSKSVTAGAYSQAQRDLYKLKNTSTPQAKSPVETDLEKAGLKPSQELTSSKLQPSIAPPESKQANPTSLKPLEKKVVPKTKQVKVKQSSTIPNTQTTKKSRFADKTVQQSQEVSQPVKKEVRTAEPIYQTVTDEARILTSEKYLKSKGVKKATLDIKERLTSKNVDDQTVSDAIAVAKALDAGKSQEGLLESSAIYEQLATKLSKAGQTIQAASLLNNRTPEGLQYGALRALKKAGVEPTVEQKKEIGRLIDGVRKSKAGTYEDGLARYKVQEYVQKQVPSAKSKKLVQLWKAGLLTSPRTTAGNLAANTFEAVFRKGYVDPVSNAFDALASVFTGKRSRSMTFKGIGSGAVEGTKKGVSYFKTGYDPRNPAQKFDVKNVHYSDTKAGKAAEIYTQGVFRLMGAQDQPFYYAALRNSLYDQAITEAKNQGLKGDAKNDFIKKFITEPDIKTMELADKEARYAVFQDETALGKAASRLKSTEGATGTIAEFVIPFSGVPSSIATRMVTRTPIGTAVEISRQIKSGKYDQRAMTKSIAEGSAIIPLVGVGYALMQAGLMTLGFPEDKKERELWEADGRQPYSIKFGDTWLSTNYFQPAGNLIAAGAEYAGQIEKGENPQKALSTAVGGAMQSLTEQSFLQGVSGTLNAIQQPDRYAQRFVEQTAGSVVPNIVRTAARATDPVARSVDSAGDAFKAGLPWARQTLDVKKDLFGRPVERRSTPANEILNPFKPSDSKNKSDSVLTEITRLQNAGEGIIPSQADKKTFEGFSDSELRDIDAEIGSKVRTEWDKIMATQQYKAMSDRDKKRILERVNDTVYDSVKAKNIEGYELSERGDKYFNGYSVDFFDGFEYDTPEAGSRAVFGDNPNKKASTQFSAQTKQFGLPDRQLNDDQTYEYSKLVQELPSLNSIDKEKKTSAFIKNVYKSDLDEVSKSFYSLGDDDMRTELQKGTITKAQMDKVIAIDDMLTNAGLQPYLQVGKKLRAELGYGTGTTASSKSGGRKSSGGSKAKKGKFDYTKDLFGSSVTSSSISKSLRSILENAMRA